MIRKIKILATSIFCTLVILSCKNSSSLILLNTVNEAEIKVRSSCKISAFSPLEKEEELKQSMLNQQAASLKKYKIKQSSSENKATYKIMRSQFIITERCGVKTAGGKPFVGFHQVILLENMKTKDTLSVVTDTTYITNSSLSTPNSFVQKKIDPLPYVNALTDKTIKILRKKFSK